MQFLNDINKLLLSIVSDMFISSDFRHVFLLQRHRKEDGVRLQDGVGQIEVEETNLLGRGAGGVVCRASHKPTGRLFRRRVWKMVWEDWLKDMKV